MASNFLHYLLQYLQRIAFVILGDEEVKIVPNSDVADFTGFWLWFGRTADILGITSFFISLITLFVTSGIKRAQRRQVEKSDYSMDVDNQIEKLQSFHDLIMVNEGDVASLMYELEETLLTIEIYYEMLLPKKVKAEINGLKNYLQFNLGKAPYSESALKNVARQLTVLMARLKKVKKNL